MQNKKDNLIQLISLIVIFISFYFITYFVLEYFFKTPDIELNRYEYRITNYSENTITGENNVDSETSSNTSNTNDIEVN